MIRLMACFVTIISFFVFAAATVASAASYKLSMLPRYSTEEITSRVVPLAKYLSEKTGLEIVPAFMTTFEHYKKELLSGTIDIGFQNPYIYVLASQAHEVVAMAVKGTDRDKFRGIVITHSNSPLRMVSELKGKKIAIVGSTSAGGYLSQKLTLLENGIDIEKDCVVEEAPENKQENVVFAVYTGEVDAGFIRESALHQADAFVPASALRVMTGTAWLPNWALSVSRSMPQADRKKLVKAIQEMKSSDPVMQALHIMAFRMAQDSEYDVVRRAAGLVE